MIDVSVAINLHREGALARGTLLSAARAIEVATAEGWSCETLAVVDRGDEATREAVAAFGGGLRVEPCDFGDLGAARNHGVARANGEMIAFMDGDDLMGERWLTVAARAVHEHADKRVVVHPRYNYMFGGDDPPFLLTQPDMIETPLDPRLLIFANLWTSLVFARAEVFRAFPYPANDLEAGFGYEDWSWNFATVNAGVLHLAPEEGVHFIRRKTAGSLHARSREAAILPNLWGRPRPRNDQGPQTLTT